MKWIKVQNDLSQHPKAIKLARALDIEVTQAVGITVVLWGWVQRNREDGELIGLDADDIAIASGWSGDPAILISAFLSVRLIDETPEGFCIHDWEDHAGEKSVDAQRKAAYRRRKHEQPQENPAQDKEKDPDVQDMSRTCPTMSQSVPDNFQGVRDMSHDVQDMSHRGEERRGEEKRVEKRREDLKTPMTTAFALAEGEPDSNLNRTKQQLQLSIYVDAFNRGASGKIKAASPPSNATQTRDKALQFAITTFPDPEDWKLASRALSASSWVSKSDYDKFGLRWLLGLTKGRKPDKWDRERVEQWVEEGRRIKTDGFDLRETEQVIQQQHGFSGAGAATAAAGLEWLKNTQKKSEVIAYA